MPNSISRWSIITLLTWKVWKAMIMLLVSLVVSNAIHMFHQPMLWCGMLIIACETDSDCVRESPCIDIKESKTHDGIMDKCTGSKHALQLVVHKITRAAISNGCNGLRPENWAIWRCRQRHWRGQLLVL